MYEENPELVKEIFDNGTKKAQEKAKETMIKVSQSMTIDY